MVFSRSYSTPSSSKEMPPPIKVVGKLSPVQPDTPVKVSGDFTTVASFNMLSNIGRDIILRGAPPSMGRLVPTRRPTLSPSSSGSSGSRPTLGSSVSGCSISSSTASSFLSSGLPSAERTYPVLALLEVLRHSNQQHTIIDGLDVIADSASLAQIAKYQRDAQNGDSSSVLSSSPTSLSPSSASGSGSSSGSRSLKHKKSGGLKKIKSRTFSFKSSSSSKSKPPPLPFDDDQLRIHVLLQGNTLILLSDLSLALNHLEDTPETRQMRLKMAVSMLTHSPLHGSNEHRRAIRYNAGGLSLLVHFAAQASLAEYPPHQPFIPVSHAPCEFARSKIDYHVIPEAVPLPLQHDLLVHCAFDEPDGEQQAQTVDEMTFCRIDKLMEIHEVPRRKAKEPIVVENLGVKSVETDLSASIALVAPFLRKLKEELKAKKSRMVFLQQQDNREIIILEDREPLAALSRTLKTYGA